MLSKDMQIGQLPCNIETQLHRVGDFYICTTFNEDVIGPRVVKIGESIYYRFMKYIYLPQLPEELNPEQVIQVCNLRLDYMEELVDYKLNRCIINTMAENVLATNIFSQLKALDFGCGSGLSSQMLLARIPNLNLTSVDISEKGVFHSRKQGLAALLILPDSPLPFKSATFDLIFAVFVMHFNIDISTLVELRRVLRPSGQFVFNFCERDKDEVPEQPPIRDVDAIMCQLEEAGFCSIKVLSHIEGISPNHKIISCSPLPLLATASHGNETEPQNESGI